MPPHVQVPWPGGPWPRAAAVLLQERGLPAVVGVPAPRPHDAVAVCHGGTAGQGADQASRGADPAVEAAGREARGQGAGGRRAGDAWRAQRADRPVGSRAAAAGDGEAAEVAPEGAAQGERACCVRGWLLSLRRDPWRLAAAPISVEPRSRSPSRGSCSQDELQFVPNELPALCVPGTGARWTRAVSPRGLAVGSLLSEALRGACTTKGCVLEGALLRMADRWGLAVNHRDFPMSGQAGDSLIQGRLRAVEADLRGAMDHWENLNCPHPSNGGWLRMAGRRAESQAGAVGDAAVRRRSRSVPPRPWAGGLRVHGRDVGHEGPGERRASE